MPRPPKKATRKYRTPQPNTGDIQGDCTGGYHWVKRGKAFDKYTKKKDFDTSAEGELLKDEPEKNTVKSKSQGVAGEKPSAVMVQSGLIDNEIIIKSEGSDVRMTLVPTLPGVGQE